MECGWAQSRIANYEAAPDKLGAREPDFAAIATLSKALGVSEAEILGLVEPMTPQKAALNAIYEKLDDKRRAELVSNALKIAEPSEVTAPVARARARKKHAS